MSTITVGLGERSYRILFGHDFLAGTGTVCRDLKLGSTVAVVTNPTVGDLYYEQVEDSLAKAGFAVHRIEIPDGEGFKNIETLKGIFDRLIEAGLDRGSFVLALGGGVVGDITGFAAATYLRGIPFVQVPTTLLAQVDSSVGGKTGINHEKGKNLIGAFYQPVTVLVDVATLDTLPGREFLSGMAEVVKYGVTLDGALFDLIADNTAKLLARDSTCLLAVIKRCCELKASIVAQDERETGLRAVLNYGHTFGHAIETLTGYKEYTHGEAVAIGMVQAAKISEHLGYSGPRETARIVTLLENLGLPTRLPSFSATAYEDALMRDKKVRDKGLSFVFNKGIGAYHIDRVSDVMPLLKISGTGA
ncbi:MAG TPA: 3-dehydroquinate synthase [Geobacteraceae bacterium]|nr:3-dehydroquinate synthase [Geobacteraceae bacterium]